MEVQKNKGVKTYGMGIFYTYYSENRTEVARIKSKIVWKRTIAIMNTKKVMHVQGHTHARNLYQYHYNIKDNK